MPEKSATTIDYSKWDKIDYGSDNDDLGSSTSSSHDDPSQSPRVLRLNEPSRITRESDGTLSVEPERSGAMDKTHLNSESVGRKNVERVRTKNGASFFDPSFSRQVYWSQDRLEVILCVAFDPTEISSMDIRVEVSGALRYSDRYSAVGSQENKGELKIVSRKKDLAAETLLQGFLPHFVHYPENEEEVDWEIDTTDPATKFVRVTLLKAVPMYGVTVWWSRPLTHFPEIDLELDIESRLRKQQDSRTTTRGDQMREVWDEAHRLFRDKIKNRKPTDIRIEDEKET